MTKFHPNSVPHCVNNYQINIITVFSVKSNVCVSLQTQQFSKKLKFDGLFKLYKQWQTLQNACNFNQTNKYRKQNIFYPIFLLN